MFGPINTIVDHNFVLNAQECHAEHAVLLNAAIKVFNQALSRGRFVRLWNWLRGEPGCLLSLNGRSRRLIGSHYAGLKTVPISHICGSEG